MLRMCTVISTPQYGNIHAQRHELWWVVRTKAAAENLIAVAKEAGCFVRSPICTGCSSLSQVQRVLAHYIIPACGPLLSARFINTATCSILRALGPFHKRGVRGAVMESHVISWHCLSFGMLWGKPEDKARLREKLSVDAAKKIRWCYAFRRSHILRFSHQHLLLGTTFEHSGLGGCGSNWRGGGTHSSAKQISHHVSILAVFSAASRAAGCCRCCCWWWCCGGGGGAVRAGSTFFVWYLWRHPYSPPPRPPAVERAAPVLAEVACLKMSEVCISSIYSTNYIHQFSSVCSVSLWFTKPIGPK